MSLDDYRSVFIGVSLVLLLLAASPILSAVVPLSVGGEHFSEFWVLGSTHMASGYPFNIRANETYKLFVVIANHLGSSAYYVVYLKFRNQSQPLPDVTASEASPLEPVYTYRAFIVDRGSWESPLTISIQNSARHGGSIYVTSMFINDALVPLEVSSTWDSAGNGFYFELFLELWLYNTASSNLRFHNRFSGIWLNMTS